ncbi:MAG: PhaM family polyhydroxyalkanoate granule multifunctional regulatory protein [Hydrogenophaga sp.]|jgi:hypothetical protein|uniref:PhaM family polyhydroxyalkanoate granule multifunctional regulatory protein n=1 Tax=Hydrogenophaga sp. TaxID=1904254 RepID=UPI002AB88963|nr:PhaM family polyhydroxyalkanoate granule multifunctional regulatory protein [Hydrogenophaga sp.]
MSDTSGSGFGKFVPGFEFLQNLASQAAGGVAQGLGQSIPQLPNLGNWVAPTYNVEDLEKRIEELKAVHFWLDQNAKALGATIQALEVQKMTLATLKNMNFSMGDVANALKVKAAETLAGFTGASQPPAADPTPNATPFAGLEIPPRTYGTAAPTPPQPEAPAQEAASEVPAGASTGGVVDPMQWWGALSQQFQHIAANALKDVAKQTALDTTREVASGLTEQAVKTATGMAGQVTRGLTDTVARNVGMAAGVGKAAVRAAAPGSTPRKAPKKPATQAAPRKAPARKPATAPKAGAAAQPSAPGDWSMPSAFFQVPGFSMGKAAAPQAPAKPASKAAKTAAKPVVKSASKPVAKKVAAKKAAPASRRS